MPSSAHLKRWGTIVSIGLVLTVLCILWVTPIFGLFVSSFRDANSVRNSGWWSIIPHREWAVVESIPLPQGTQIDRPITVNINGTDYTMFYDEWTENLRQEDTQIQWVGTLRVGAIEVRERQWVSNFDFTLANYSAVLAGQEASFSLGNNPDFAIGGRQNTGGTVTATDAPLSEALINSFIVTIPATIIPLLLATLAAYAFAWMRFRGRYLLFATTILLLVVPLQVALTPLLRDFNVLGINGTFISVWLAHTGFGLPLAVFLLYNYIVTLPRETLESAFIDGASHFTVFTRLILPLSVPVIISFAIFQFLWVWNDYLVASIFIGTTPGYEVLTQRLVDLQGERGSDWHILTAAGFVSIIVPLIVFLSLQRFFVRGLLAGSVKG